MAARNTFRLRKDLITCEVQPTVRHHTQPPYNTETAPETCQFEYFGQGKQRCGLLANKIEYDCEHPSSEDYQPEIKGKDQDLIQ